MKKWSYKWKPKWKINEKIILNISNLWLDANHITYACNIKHDWRTHTYTHTLVVSHGCIRKALCRLEVLRFYPYSSATKKLTPFHRPNCCPLCPPSRCAVGLKTARGFVVATLQLAPHGQQWMSVANISRHIPVMGLEHGNGWNPRRLQGFYLDDPVVKVLCNSWIFKSCHIHWMHLDALPGLSVNHLSRLMFRGFPGDISDLHNFFMPCHAFPNLNRSAPD